MTVTVTREQYPQIELYGAYEGVLEGTSSGDRVSLTFTPTDDFLIMVVKNDLTHVQLEAGSSAGPYIPTAGAAATRSKTGASKALGDLVGFRQDQYTVVAEFESAGSDGADTPFVYTISDGTANEAANASLSTANALTSNTVDGGVSQAALSLGSYTPDDVAKVAAAHKAGDFAASVDGGAAVTDAAGTMPAVTTVRLGASSTAANHLNGYIGFLSLTPIRADDATLVTESA